MASSISVGLAAERRPSHTFTSAQSTTSRPGPPSPAPSSSNDGSVSDEFSVLDLDLSTRASTFSISNLTCATSVTGSISPCLSPSTDKRRSEDASTHARLTTATCVLATEAAALAKVTELYANDRETRNSFSRAVAEIVRLPAINGKLVLIGVGKSGIIARKLVATFTSLGICAVFLHPTEALHGDLGVLQPNDTLLVITFSGKTPELLLLQSHLPSHLPTILLTAHIRPDECPFIRARPCTILLPTPIPVPEKTSFGVSAPTSSTTTALALGDALAMTAAQELSNTPENPNGLSAVFATNHPGGAIGQAFRAAPQTLADLLTNSVDEIPLVEACAGAAGGLTCADVLRAGFDVMTSGGTGGGWLRLVDGGFLPPGRIQTMRNEQMSLRIEDVPGLVVTRDDMVEISGKTNVRVAQDLVRSTNVIQGGVEFGRGDDAVVAVLDERGMIMGVVEAGAVLSQ